MIDFKRLLPNWKLEIEEISSNVYQFIAENSHVNRVEITESDYDAGYRKCMADTFDIELKLNRDNKFLYDTFLRLIDPSKIIDHRYDHFALGSWFIQTERKRIILDGRDFVLRVDGNLKNEWIMTNSINNYDTIKLTSIEMIIDEFK